MREDRIAQIELKHARGRETSLRSPEISIPVDPTDPLLPSLPLQFIPLVAVLLFD